MAKKKLFGNNIKPSCKYCELGIAGEGDRYAAPRWAT